MTTMNAETAASRGDPLIEIIDLKTHFFTDEGVVKAIDGVTFDIPRGKTLCVVGEYDGSTPPAAPKRTAAPAAATSVRPAFLVHRIGSSPSGLGSLDRFILTDHAKNASRVARIRTGSGANSGGRSHQTFTIPSLRQETEP